MMITKTNMALIFTIAAILGGLGSSCAKKREYETLVKDEVMSKSVISTTVGNSLGDEYLYVPSMIEAPHSTNGTFPGWLGSERIVRFRFTKDALLAETVVDDSRFNTNPTNSKPVLSIPVSHLEYRCADNAAGNCSNQEEEVDDISWEQKTKFKPNVQALKVTEVNTLPIEIDNLFESCHQELGERLVGYSIEGESIRIEVEKTYRSKVECLTELDSLSDLTFNVRHVHSFVKRSALVAKDYEIIKYPQVDENTFGLFTTEKFKLSEDNRPEEKGKEVLMNRWNPKRKTIPYLLSSNLDKPELARVKSATLEAVDAVNRAFVDAGVDLKIDARVAKEGELQTGDIRQSSIIVVEDPQATGVIGYGPSTADPRTGEIISGRVMMYLGTMKKFVRSTWDDHLETLAAKEEVKEDSALGVLSFLGSIGGSSKSVNHTDTLQEALKLNAKTSPATADSMVDVFPDFAKTIDTSTHAKKLDAMTLSKASKELKQVKIKNFMGPRTLPEEMYEKANSRIEAISKYNVYLAELVNFEGALSEAALDDLKDVRKVEWEELNEDEQKKVIDAVLPYVWVPTLVHELGHNMGLRHNFAGSEDKENFYSAEESKAHGHDHSMPYSSVMDYGYNSLKEIRVMGKYDVAALKFAYNREVEVKTGETLKVKTTLKDLGADLKEFKYCTDENVGPNPGCRRFDEGTNLTEIAQHLGRAYQKSFKRLNNRLGRRNFSINGDVDYFLRQEAAFFDLRPFFEIYNLIRDKYNVPANHPAWVMDPFLKDIMASMLASRDAILKPMLEPSRHCVIAPLDATAPYTSKQVVPMEALGEAYPSCFSEGAAALLKENGLKAIAEFGKEINNKKFVTSDNPYVDQIDVRGIWMDKLLSGMFLTQRRLGVSTFDQYRGNYVDSVSGTANALVKILDGYLMNRLDYSKIVAKEENGKPMTLEKVTIRPFNSHIVAPSTHRGLRNYIGMPNDDTPFAQLLLQNVLLRMKDTFPSSLNQQLREYYGIQNYIQDGDDYSKYTKVDVEGRHYFIHKEKHILASKVATQWDAVTKLDRLEADSEEALTKRLGELFEIAKKREAGEALPAEGLSDVEKEIAQLPSALIASYANGELPAAGYLQVVIRILGDVNRWVELNNN